MKKDLMGKVILFCTIFLLTVGSLSAWAVPDKYRKSPDPVAIMADGVLVRPLSLVSTIVGSVFYVITLPFTIPSDSADSARQQLVEYPAWFTFQRPIGNFGHRYQRENVVEQKRALKKNLEKNSETDTLEGSRPATPSTPKPVE